MLLLLVCELFQVLFHSASSGSFHLSLAVLCSLSVFNLYLALRGGPRLFTQNFSYAALLWRAENLLKLLTGLSPYSASIPTFSVEITNSI